MIRKAVFGCLLATAALGVAACGSSSKSSSTGASTSGAAAPSGGKTVDIYSSLPQQGGGKDQVLDVIKGEELALSEAGNKAGQFNVSFTNLDDSTAAAGKWDPGQAAANARKAISDPKAVYYIGEFNSGASAISIPITNQAGLPQVSPANTAVGLTSTAPGHSPGEPAKYYPTGKRNYLRVVPIDTVQAAALLKTMKADGCTKVAVANDKEVYGQGLATNMELAKGQFGINIVSNTGIDPTAPNFRALAQTIKGQGTDCFVFSGLTATGGVQIYKDVNAAIPTAKLYGPDGVCTGDVTNPAKHGIPATLAPLFKCTTPASNLAAYPGGKTFLAAFKAKYNEPNPDPYSIYGYEAMKLGLDTIAALGSKGNDKSAILAALYATKNRNSVLGTYSFNADGDTSQTTYGLYKVGPDGNPLYLKTVTTA